MDETKIPKISGWVNFIRSLFKKFVRFGLDLCDCIVLYHIINSAHYILWHLSTKIIQVKKYKYFELTVTLFVIVGQHFESE